MKWKITARFLLAILITITISSIFFTTFNISMMFYRAHRYPKDFYDLSVEAGTFTLDFNEQIKWENNQVFISKEGLKKLEDNKLWVQVLDEQGNEIYSRFKPNYIPTHYVPAQLIYYHKNEGNLKGYSIFVALAEREDRQLSYILGFPESKVNRFLAIPYNPDTVVADIIRFLLWAILFTLFIAFIIGYIFSVRLVNPIVKIIEGIKVLAQGNYDNKYTEKGLYKDVFLKLNHLGDALQRNKIEREKTQQVREEWIANISHDLNTPLSSIKGYSEVLLNPEYNLTDNERIKYAGIILNKANYIGKLVEDLKLTYQLKHCIMPLKKETLNLVEILRDTIIDILNNPEHENTLVSLYPNEEIIELNGNAMLLQRAFSNIIYNAVIHNPLGIKIDVKIRKNNGISIEIEDNGHGIKQKELENLFKRYYRGTSTGEVHKGSGLGMAIAKQIIESHKGLIEVESNFGIGTKVSIYFSI